MTKFSLVEFSVRRPKLVFLLTGLLTLLFLTQFPRIRTDTNPKHMLPDTSDVRVWNDGVDKTFGLYEDTIVVGVQSEEGVLNRETLGRIARITDAILGLDGVAGRDVNGFTTITNVTADAGTRLLDRRGDLRARVQRRPFGARDRGAAAQADSLGQLPALLGSQKSKV